MLKSPDNDALRVGAIVLYKQDDTRQYVPAIIVSVHPKVDGEKEHDLELCVFVGGLHSPSFTRNRAKRGNAVGDWVLTPEEADEALNGQKRAAEELYRKQLEKVTQQSIPIESPPPPPPPPPENKEGKRQGK